MWGTIKQRAARHAKVVFFCRLSVLVLSAQQVAAERHKSPREIVRRENGEGGAQWQSQ